MPKDPQKDGRYRYGQSNYLRKETRTWGFDPDQGMPITPDGEFDFNSGEAEVPKEVPFLKPQAPKNRR